MEDRIIELMSGARYQITSGKVYSLNYAERGMKGCSTGKELPPKLAKEVIAEWKKYEDFKYRNRPEKKVRIGRSPRKKKKTGKKLKINFS